MKRRIMDPRSVKVFVLDEADEMLKQSGFGDNCKRIKKYLK
jgi:ATP-dependent RNA helicase DDX19/DBP5